jgi:hypothetical protein
MRVMVDGVNAHAVIDALRGKYSFWGVTATMGAGYRDGPVSSPAWTSAAWQAVTDYGQPVVITVASSPTANVADIETGDMTPEQGAAWAKLGRAPADFPVLYVNRSNKAQVESLLAPLVRGVGYGLWVATLDGTFTDSDGTDLRQQPGVVAVQAQQVQVDGVTVDISQVVDDRWLPVVPPPAPAIPAWAGAMAADLAAAQTAITAASALLAANT